MEYPIYVQVGNTSSKGPFSIAMLVFGSVFVLFLGFPKIVVPQNGWFIIETPIKMDDLGGKPHYFFFGNPHIDPTFPLFLTDLLMATRLRGGNGPGHGVPWRLSNIEPEPWPGFHDRKG